MIPVWVELSGESPALAAAEAIAAAEALDGRTLLPGRGGRIPDGLLGVELPAASEVLQYAGRLALAHRCVTPVDPERDPLLALAEAGRDGRSAAVRRIGRPRSGSTDPAVLEAGRAFKEGGGRISLESPDRRFWLAATTDGDDILLEEIASVDRRAASQRRMPALPFQRPVSLPPRLARAAANLARVRAGDAVLDPFLGTGALLAEAGLLGGRLYGIDRDPAMVRGALRNFAHFGLHAESLLEGDAGAAEFEDPALRFRSIVTDPPYGRSSGSGGEEARRVVERIVPRWAERVGPGGRVVVVVPGGYDPLGPPWAETLRVAVRVHRSLTREFRVYERGVR